MVKPDQSYLGPSCPWPRRLADRRWCVVQSEYRQEATAESEIKKAGYLVYVPRYRTRVQSRTGGKRKWIDTVRPLFPAYLFADIGADAGGWGSLAKLRGVRDLIRHGEAPVLLPAFVIDELQAAEGSNFGLSYRTAAPPSPVAVNDQVRITDGPFSGIYGLIGSVDAKHGITVLIELFGRVNSVKGLAVDQVEVDHARHR